MQELLHLRKRLQEAIDSRSAKLIGGGVNDFAGYQRVVGEISGLLLTISEINDLLKNIERANDD